MKRFLFPAFIVAMAISATIFSALTADAQQPRPEQVPANGGLVPLTQPAKTATGPAVPGLSTDKQKASYGIGLRIGDDMRGGQLTTDDIDLQALMRGLSDAMDKKKPALSEEDLQQAMISFHQALQNKMKAVADKNKKDGEAFLAANKAKDGVKTLPSGLQYKVIKAGAGPTPGPTDMVKAQYKGTLLDGTVFDSSDLHGGPVDFPVNQVIKGWTEALQLMKVGDKWQLFVPSEMAYGEHGSGGDIGPNSVLVFDVELLDVTKGDNTLPGGLPGG